jgi:hypothetical protein
MKGCDGMQAFCCNFRRVAVFRVASAAVAISFLLSGCASSDRRIEQPLLPNDVFCGLIRSDKLKHDISFETTDYYFSNSYSSELNSRNYKCELFANNYDSGLLTFTVQYADSSEKDLASYTHGQTSAFSQLSADVSSSGVGWIKGEADTLLWFYPDGRVLAMQFGNVDNTGWAPDERQRSGVISLFKMLVDSVPEYNRQAGDIPAETGR